jgi:predicted transposase YbfD/YdcC
MEIGAKEYEIPVALTVREALNVNCKIVRGDALLTQRGLSAHIVAAGGEYVWTVKDNHPQLRADLEAAFAPAPLAKGFSPDPADFQKATVVNKGHGRTETRILTTTSRLKEFLDWPGVKQVFRLDRVIQDHRTGLARQKTVYGLTSLSATEAGPRRLLDLVRIHLEIENGLHYRRDVTLHEDAGRLQARGAGRCSSCSPIQRRPRRLADESKRSFTGCAPRAYNSPMACPREGIPSPCQAATNYQPQ